MDNTTYEFFFRRAWKCDRFEKGANTDTWESLLYKKYNYEEAIGKPNEANSKREYDNKFAQVKNYVDSAYNNLLYRATNANNNQTLVNTLSNLKTSAGNSTTPQQLYDVLRSSFPILNDNQL